MKPKKNKNAVVAPAPILPPVGLTLEEKKIQEFRRLTHQNEYFEKLNEFGKSDPAGKKYEQTIKFIHELFEQEEWLSKNTPFYFKISLVSNRRPCLACRGRVQEAPFPASAFAHLRHLYRAMQYSRLRCRSYNCGLQQWSKMSHHRHSTRL